VKILTISDIIERRLYSSTCKERFKDIAFILSCGDLPFYYLEFIVTILNVPLYYVFGNHHTRPMITENGEEQATPGGGMNLDMKVVDCNGLLIGGLEGSMLYNYGPKQYTERQMRRKIRRMKPSLWKNKLFKHRYLDILITHAPPAGIHDESDLCHQGFESFRSFIETYRPRYFIHGHTHRYGRQQEWKTQYQNTTVINTVGYRVLEVEEMNTDT
jgi:Icc-related predicted phosphoesterase